MPTPIFSSPPNRTLDLYEPAFEHDACGVGLVCNVNGEANHDAVRDAIVALNNLDHRGARGSDYYTGDGAGILMQLPHRFLADRATDEGFRLPEPGSYAVGVAFLKKDEPLAARSREMIEEEVASTGLTTLGWRKVPTRGDTIGETARQAEPDVWQFFVSPNDRETSQFELERLAFVARRKIESHVAANPTFRAAGVYLPSFSSWTLVYKGMLTVGQLATFYPELLDESIESAVALVHSRFSTNTLPRWHLAQPFRYLCHNGEINTLRGNVNRMIGRSALFEDDRYGGDIALLRNAMTVGGSDSQILDNALELLIRSGRTLPHALMTLVPEAWERDPLMDDAKRSFYEYHACLIEPWDGPATLPFTDGRYAGAMLDRNGLRPSRYTLTKDGRAILSSEIGVLDIAADNVEEHGRLQPGKMFLIDMQEGRVISDEEIKQRMSARQPYKTWLAEGLSTPDTISVPEHIDESGSAANLNQQLRMFGYTREDLKFLIFPMATRGKAPIGSMGNDTPLACLSNRPRLLYDYFKQLFAQVTNPPLDAIREEQVTSLYSYLGTSHNVLEEGAHHAELIRLDQPILLPAQLDRLRASEDPVASTATVDCTFDPTRKSGLVEALDRLNEAATEAIADGGRLLILSDRAADRDRAPIPALLAVGSLHQFLVRSGTRSLCSIIVESGEPREVHHFCALAGYGAEAICPYVAVDLLHDRAGSREMDGLPADTLVANYVKAAGKGVLKVMSKMGISTFRSYVGAQIFEAVGLHETLVDGFFSGTPSRISGIGLDIVAEETIMRHRSAFDRGRGGNDTELDEGGIYQWRRNGEQHAFNPLSIATLQEAVRRKDPKTYAEFAELINEQADGPLTLRALLEFDADRTPIPIDEVEPWTEIAKRFKSGAMSYGSISQETHETLAIAMNALGGKSNSGEGGEAPARYDRANPRRSRIKQVASGRFGVTISYLASADEIQIKMAQGAKPGEGGQLPGEKVYPWIARTRHSTPWVGLISPPPHHDIYSIEDLAQLIYDLKNANPAARVTVKLVAEVGVGTVAAGVAKGKADVVLISGHDGGTGASPQTSLMHAGLPWEMGLSETHQTLVRNGLRRRIRVECDGQLKTGRDVAIAALLGADEFGFATAPLVALGCIMMRKCHLNTCPVGIATQDPELRKKFTGQPEHVINYVYFVAEELRAIMAKLGFRTVDEMVGRADVLRPREDVTHWKARHIDLSRVLAIPETPEYLTTLERPDLGSPIDGVLDHELVARAEPALGRGDRVEIDVTVRNTNRTVGTILSYEVVKRQGMAGLPSDTIVVRATGSAGQSFGAFGAPGITFVLTGNSNDYFGKGLSGARLIVKAPPDAGFNPHDNIIIGNVALYGATSGEVFIRGRAGERFGVRNSGVVAVVEGVGDHGCEYMTGGTVVVLGPTGRNFAAGMSGGTAYVIDGTRQFRSHRYNNSMVEVLDLDVADEAKVLALCERHYNYTASTVARWVLDNWDDARLEFVKVIPTEYRLALERLAQEASARRPAPDRVDISVDREGSTIPLLLQKSYASGLGEGPRWE